MEKMSTSQATAVSMVPTPAVAGQEILEGRVMALVQDAGWSNTGPEGSGALLQELMEVLFEFNDLFSESILNRSPSNAVTAEDRLHSLSRWLEQNKIVGVEDSWRICFINKIRGNGVICTKDIKEGDILMNIPAAAMLSARFGRGRLVNSSILSGEATMAELLDKFSDNETLALAVALMFQNADKDSFFRPYLDMLPEVYQTPLFWDMDCFMTLFSIYPEVGHKAVSTFRAAAALYIRVLHTIRMTLSNQRRDHSLYPSWSLFRWAMAATTSRQNEVPMVEEGMRPTLALIPGWDFMNHDPQASPSTSYICVEGDDHSGCLQFAATSDLKRGDEVLMNYGRRSNIDCLLYAGFCVSDNIHDVVAMNIILPVDLGRLRTLLFERLLEVCAKGNPTDSSLRFETYRLMPDKCVHRILFKYQPHLPGKECLPQVALCAAIASSVRKEESSVLLRDILAHRFDGADSAPMTCVDVINSLPSEAQMRVKATLEKAASGDDMTTDSIDSIFSFGSRDRICIDKTTSDSDISESRCRSGFRICANDMKMSFLILKETKVAALESFRHNVRTYFDDIIQRSNNSS